MKKKKNYQQIIEEKKEECGIVAMGRIMQKAKESAEPLVIQMLTELQKRLKNGAKGDYIVGNYIHLETLGTLHVFLCKKGIVVSQHLVPPKDYEARYRSIKEYVQALNAFRLFKVAEKTVSSFETYLWEEYNPLSQVYV